MKRRDPVLLGDVMRQFLDPAALDDNANQQRLVAFWPDVVGEYINRQTVRRCASGLGKGKRCAVCRAELRQRAAKPLLGKRRLPKKRRGRMGRAADAPAAGG
jgi:hypothetical protein